MSDPTSSLRGAVDLGSLGRTAPPSSTGGAPAGASPSDPTTSPVVVVGTDANFNQVVQRSVTVPAVAVVWSSQSPETLAALQVIVDAAERREGRLQVVSLDVATNPAVLQAIQPPQLPMSLGLLSGQAYPLFPGVPEQSAIEQVIDEFLALAVQQGVTGRVEIAAPDDDGGTDEELSPLHQEAFDAIERDDLDAAADAYERALAANPGDEDARLGLGQVSLMQRTRGVDLTEARAAAAADPGNIDAAIVVADLDVLGGHVEDAFLRLIELVKASDGEDRDRVRAHLLDLFAVVGNSDERVRRGRTSLMSALF